MSLTVVFFLPYFLQKSRQTSVTFPSRSYSCRIKATDRGNGVIFMERGRKRKIPSKWEKLVREKENIDDVFQRWRAAAVPLTNVKLSKSVNPLVRRKNRVRTGHSCTPGRGTLANFSANAHPLGKRGGGQAWRKRNDRTKNSIKIH